MGGGIKVRCAMAEQAREQGGVFRRDTTSQRAGTGDMDAQKEEGEG